jgi:pre-mRNA-splicing factor ISY1
MIRDEEEEKAKQDLERWMEIKLGIKPTSHKPVRPRNPDEVSDLKTCEIWRAEIFDEIRDKIMYIQNPELGEHRIRDLNDDINRLYKERKLWENRILTLNGPDYTKVQPKIYDEDGKEVMEIDGHYYYGAGRDLPGVRELYEKKNYVAPRLTRVDLYKKVDSVYYGLMDENEVEDIEEIENEIEEKIIQKEIEKFKEIQKQKELNNTDKIESEEVEIYKSYYIPNDEEVQYCLLEKRKKEILSLY